MWLRSGFSLAWLLMPELAFALVGFEQFPYDPVCAYACARAVGSNPLSCSSYMDMSEGMEGNVPMTSPECYAGDTAFLTTLAWCVSSKCASAHLPASTIDRFWEGQAIGNPNSGVATGKVTVSPKWTYAQALQHIVQQPTRVLGNDDILNFTALVNSSVWSLQADTLESVYHEEAIHAKLGVALLVIGFGIPVVLTWMGYLPYMTGLLHKLNPYVVYPATFGTCQRRLLQYLLSDAPTTGQSLYIAVIFILTVLLAAVGYETVLPHGWYANIYQEVMAYVMWRTGVLGFALLPLVILFAGRNNILLWLSNWSHSTYLLLHRWVARIFGILVILHSILALALYRNTGSFASNEKMSWWIWGVVATLTTVILMVASGPYLRRWSYNSFLIMHILLTVFTIVGCWYHVVYLEFGFAFGYPQWIYAACAVWFFDRLVRVMRIAKAGIRRSQVTDLTDDYVRVDVKGVRWDAVAGNHMYAYFPTLHPLRPWENHPFSPLPTSMLRSFHQNLNTHGGGHEEITDQDDIEKHMISTTQMKVPPTGDSTAGITFFIRKSTGMTKSLKANDSLLTLLEGPYPSNSTKSCLKCDRLLLIGGGIGITGLLPWANIHPNVKLYWSVKKTAECLVQAVDVVLNNMPEKEIKVGHRLDIRTLLNREFRSGWAKIGVVVCGPRGLCDDVRAGAVAAGKKESVVFELQIDSYAW